MRILLIVIGFWISLSLSARTFIREYTYRAGEADSKITARSIALEQVKRLLLEEVGVYIQSSISNSETESNGVVSSLTEKEIQVLSAGITETKVITETWNGETYYLKAQISLDEKDVLSRLDDLINNTKDKELLEQNRITTDNALSEMERLKEELEQEKDKNRQLELQQQYAAEAGKLSAIEYFEKGQDLTSVDADNFKEAAGWYQKAVDADSTFADAWFKLGQCRYFTDDFGQARYCLQKSYELNRDPHALVWIANCYSGLKDYYTALPIYQQAYDQSKDLEDLARVAECYFNMDQLDESRKVYEQILAADPNNFTATNYVSLVYLRLKEYDKAIACYFKLITLEADSTSMYGSIADAYSDKGDFANAQKYYTLVTQYDPEASYQWAYLATASFNNGDYPQAIKALKRDLELNPGDLWAENLLGRSYEQINDLENSRKYHIQAAVHGSTESQDWCNSLNIKWQ